MNINSIAALKTLLKNGTPEAYVSGYYAPGDGGGGHYWCDINDTDSDDNGGTVIVANDGGRWKLILQQDSVSIKQFGAKGDGANDDTAAIQAAIDYALAIGDRGSVHAPAGSYLISSLNISVSEYTTLVFTGEGAYKSTFAKYDSSTTALFHLTGTGNGFISKIQLKNIGLNGNNKTHDGIYCNLLAHFFFEGVSIEGCDVAFKSLGGLDFAVRSCYFRINNVGFLAGKSPDVGTGYSNLILFDSCIFQNHSEYAIHLEKGQNIVFNNCSLENNTADEVVYLGENYAEEAETSSVSFNNCWWEGNTGELLLAECAGTFISLNTCTLFGIGKKIIFEGTGNAVNLKNCYGQAGLEMDDAGGFLTVDSCQFTTLDIDSVLNYSLSNLQYNLGAIHSAHTKQRIGDQADKGTGAISQVTGMAQATKNFLGEKGVTINGTPKELVEFSFLSALTFIHGYKDGHGVLSWWLLAGDTVIQSDDNTGNTQTFAVSGDWLTMATSAGTLTVNVTALL